MQCAARRRLVLLLGTQVKTTLSSPKFSDGPLVGGPRMRSDDARATRETLCAAMRCAALELNASHANDSPRPISGRPAS
eukprot:6630410-Pyramimonas_sp.AAC.1